MKEFVSKLEDLIKAEELRFKPTPGFGKTYKKFLGQAIAHPAKMNTQLTEFLIRKFTEEGDVVLDPMAGSGQTGVIAAVHGRDAVCVELEQKFFKWMEQAREKVETQQTLAKKGKIRNVLGDARQLSQLLQEADVVVTSPPYSECLNESKNTTSNLQREERLKTAGHLPKTFMGGKVRNCSVEDGLRYSHNPSNIGNLRHGKVDAIVTSPPYVGKEQKAQRSKGWGPWNLPHQKEGFKREKPKSEPYEYSENDENIGNLKHGRVDSIITSPPYAESVHANSGAEERGLRLENAGHNAKDFQGGKARCCEVEWNYGKNRENIGNLRFADCIVTSPPYGHESVVGAGNKSKIIKEKFNAVPYDETEYGRKRDVKTGKYLPTKIDANIARLSFSNQDYPNNITTPKKETYLEAMLTVYRQMHSVLKPQGKAIIIIKPFIRNKKGVDLPYQTWLLLKQAGFKLTRLFKLRLKQQSFWRILYHRKFPDVAQIKHEYVLVTIKHGGLEA